MTSTCICGAKIPVSETSGRPRRYCSAACRQRAYRRRRAVPGKMRRSSRWVRFVLEPRGDGLAKVPLQLNGRRASVREPKHWTTYAAARASEVGEGIGWVLGDDIGCIDIDSCFDAGGHLAPWAAAIVAKYQRRALLIERSVSGGGLHIFMRMRAGAGRRIRDGRNIEVYPPDSGRYIAVTGNRFALDEGAQSVRALRPCGTPAAARRHRRRGETACRACRDAENAARSAREASRVTQAQAAAASAAAVLPAHLDVTAERRWMYERIREALTSAAPEEVSGLVRQGAQLLEHINDGCRAATATLSRMSAARSFA